MKKRFWLNVLLVTFGLAVGLMLPLRTSAQSSSETITAQVTLMLPSGQSMSGAFVDHRTLGAGVQSTWTFNGMIDGLPAKAAGTATERWLGDGQLEVTMTSITEFTVAGQTPAQNADGSPFVPQSLLQTLVIENSGAGVVTVRGIPLAMGGELLPPGSGDMAYSVTNAGQGPQRVTSIPNTSTGEATPASPVVPAITLIVGLALLALGGTLLRARRMGAR